MRAKIKGLHYTAKPIIATVMQNTAPLGSYCDQRESPAPRTRMRYFVPVT